MIPIRLTVDEDERTLELDPEILLSYIKKNFFPEEKKERSFRDSQFRTAIKAAIKLGMALYVEPLVADASYPKFAPSKSDDYISSALLYLVRLVCDIGASHGGASIAVTGSQITSVEWGAPAYHDQPA